MHKLTSVNLAICALLFTGIAFADQYPLIDQAANTVIQKYQTADCEQLWQAHDSARSPQEQELVQILQDNPEARAIFLQKVSNAITNKMFACGMLP